MKKFVYTLLIVIVVVAVLISAKDAILMFVIEKEVKTMTGIQVGMESLRVGFIDATVEIKDLKIYNPPEYPDRIMLDMPEIYVDFDLPDILKGKVHLTQLKLDVAEFMVVRNRAGELNLNTLKVVRKGKDEKAKGENRLKDIQIDLFQLKIDKVVFKDYSKGLKPDVKVFNIHIDQEFKDITDPDSLVRLIVVRALRNTAIARLTGFDLGALQEQVSGILIPAQNVITRAGGGAAKTLVGAADTVNRAVVGLEDALFHPAAKTEEKKPAGGAGG